LGREAAQALDFEALETAVRRQALRFAARVVEQQLNADHSDFTGPSQPCSCGRSARYVDRRAKPFQTVLGELRLQRAYYYCAACQQGFCPRDQQLGMEDTSLSPAVTRMIGTVGALVSFQEGSELLQELAGVEVGAKQVERTAEALGAEVAEDERHQVEVETEGPHCNAASGCGRRLRSGIFALCTYKFSATRSRFIKKIIQRVAFAQPDRLDGLKLTICCIIRWALTGRGQKLRFRRQLCHKPCHKCR